MIASISPTIMNPGSRKALFCMIPLLYQSDITMLADGRKSLPFNVGKTQAGGKQTIAAREAPA
jgi:hypothetical protein